MKVRFNPNVITIEYLGHAFVWVLIGAILGVAFSG